MFRSALALRFALFRTQRLQPLPEPSQVGRRRPRHRGRSLADHAGEERGRLPRRQADGHRLGREVDGHGRPRLVPAVGGDVVTGLLAGRRHVVARAREGRHAGCAGEGGRVRRVLGLAHLVLGEPEVDDDRGQREDHHRERGHDDRDRPALVVPATGAAGGSGGGRPSRAPRGPVSSCRRGFAGVTDASACARTRRLLDRDVDAGLGDSAGREGHQGQQSRVLGDGADAQGDPRLPGASVAEVGSGSWRSRRAHRRCPRSGPFGPRSCRPACAGRHSSRSRGRARAEGLHGALAGTVADGLARGDGVGEPDAVVDDPEQHDQQERRDERELDRGAPRSWRLQPCRRRGESCGSSCWS